jgi:hypothetical protein
MGTSKNVASPDTPPWKFALAVLGRPAVPLELQNREIWRSVEAERGPRVIDDFSHPALAAACRLASGSSNVQTALHAYDEQLVVQNKSGFAVEIGRRALARAVLSNQGSEGFARELFAEATSYYASRDLPSFVGSKGRVETTSASIALKANLKEITRTIVESAGAPSLDPEGWTRFVSNVVRRLKGRR